MTQDSTAEKQKEVNFIQKVCETGFVWALENAEGFATSSSNQYEDEEGEPVEMICFWSNESLAAACAKEDWNEYTPAKLPLGEFIENWCTGMANDELLLGIDFDENMFGFEADPLELILELSEGLKVAKQKVVLKNYEKLSDLVDEVKKALEE